jgi:hypothetical protein
MMSSHDPVGPENDHWLRYYAEHAGICVAAWGNHGSFLHRSRDVVSMLPDLHCFKLNQSGEPVHPLYQPRYSQPIPM